MLSASQLRAARALLDWSQTQLAEAAGLSLPTVKRMESEKGPGKSTAENVEAVEDALTSAGIVFIPGGAYQGEGGPGVRLRGEE